MGQDRGPTSTIATPTNHGGRTLRRRQRLGTRSHQRKPTHHRSTRRHTHRAGTRSQSHQAVSRPTTPSAERTTTEPMTRLPVADPVILLVDDPLVGPDAPTTYTHSCEPSAAVQRATTP